MRTRYSEIIVKHLIIFSSLLHGLNVSAQNCGCTHIITTPTGGITFDGLAVTPKVKPGDVLCFQAGTRGRIIMKNIVGTAANPVIIKNCGGQAIIAANPVTEVNSNPILMMGCKYFKFTGTGDPSILYGIKILNGSNGLALSGLCTNFEIEHIEISNCSFAGIMAKTDPTCADPSTWRENFTMYNVSIHHNYVHDVQGEGFYIGNSFFNSAPPATDICGKKYPHAINGLDVYRNIVKRTGCEGIQVGSAPYNCKIHDNTIDTAGLNPFANFQNNGLQIGSGTGGLCYNNWINYAPGNGISCLGIGDNFLYNNIIINPGADTATIGLGIFMDEQATADSLLGPGMKFINNTIINSIGNGIRIYNDRIGMNYLYNNIILQYGTNPEYVRRLNSNVQIDLKGNVFLNDQNAFKFQDFAKYNYHLAFGSPAIAAGVNVAAFGVTYDHSNTPRSAPYDAGAFAYVPPVTTGLNSQAAAAPALFVYPNPVNISNDQISLRFYLESDSEISIQTYDLEGKLIGTENTTFYPSGWNELKTSKSTTAKTKGAIVFVLMANGEVKDSQIVIVQ